MKFANEIKLTKCDVSVKHNKLEEFLIHRRQSIQKRYICFNFSIIGASEKLKIRKETSEQTNNLSN